MKCKKLLNLLCLLLAFTMILGFAPAAQAAEAGGKTDLRIAVQLDAFGFDPFFSGYNPASAIPINCIYETLINMSADGNIYPGLATEWEWGEDAMSIILHLREGVTFTNGDDMNADAVIWSLRDYRGASAVGEAETLYDFANMEKLDDYTVEIPLLRPGSDAFITLADQIYAIVSKTAAEEYGDDYINNPVGTGPYKFVSFVSGVGTTLEANEDYWGGAPTIKTVETVLISEPSQAEIELESGNIDIMTFPDTIDVQRILDGEVEGLTTVEAPSGLCKNLWFNFRREASQDDNLRKAISCAIDKEAIIDVVYGGFATVANQMIVNNNDAYDPSYDENPLYPYDLDLAKEYLSKSNYPDGLDMTIYADTTPSEVRIMELVQNNLAQIGINVEIFSLDSNAIGPALWGGEEDDMYTGISCTSMGYAPGFLKNCSPNMTPHWGAWELMECNKEINDLYEQSLAATDMDECNELVKQAVRLEMENAMAVPICYPVSYITCSAKLQNIAIDARSSGGGLGVLLLKDAYFTE